MIENQLLQLLIEHNLKIATAESCTGGMIASLLCDIPGISACFEEGYVTYSTNAKIKNLDVLPDTIATYGLVSVETAEAMAIGAAKRANAQCAVATTGVAGPSGGTEENPVGTVCFGCVVKNQVFSKRMIFEEKRMEVRMQAAVFALEFLSEKIVTYYESDDKDYNNE